MALTLLEAQKHAKTPQELAVVTELAAGQLMSVLPFRNIEGNGLFWKREESLPDVGFRNYNGALAESYAEVSQQSESLKLFGGDIKVDRAIVDLEGAEAKAYQVQSRVRAMRMAWEALFINGDSNQSPSEWRYSDRPRFPSKKDIKIGSSAHRTTRRAGGGVPSGCR